MYFLTCPDVLDDVRHPEHQLVLYGRHPGVVVQLQDGPGAQEVQVAEAGREDGQSVALEVEFSEAGELSYLLGNIHQVVVSDSQDPQVLQVLDLGTQVLKIVITEVQSPARKYRNEIDDQYYKEKPTSV